MEESFRLHPIPEPLPHPEQEPVRAVHAEHSALRSPERDRLSVGKRARCRRVEVDRVERNERGVRRL
jgi:hypothetical protein